MPAASRPPDFDAARRQDACEELFEFLARSNPGELVRLLGSGELEPTLLTFAAEHAGKIELSDLAVPALERLLDHPKSYVREGAVYGLGQHTTHPAARSALARVAESDSDPVVRKAAEEMIARGAAPEPDAVRWARFLADLQGHGLTDRQAAALRSTWQEIVERVGADAPLPMVTAHDDHVSLAWNREHEYLDVQLFADGLEWFYRGRQRGDVEGTAEGREASIPDAFFARLRALRP
jgi:hypothetical protein